MADGVYTAQVGSGTEVHGKLSTQHSTAQGSAAWYSTADANNRDSPYGHLAIPIASMSPATMPDAGLSLGVQLTQADLFQVFVWVLLLQQEAAKQHANLNPQGKGGDLFQGKRC